MTERRPAPWWQIALALLVALATAGGALYALAAPGAAGAGVAGAASAGVVGTPPALRVSGVNLVDPAGQAVRLVGVTRPTLEQSCAGDGHFTVANFQAIRAWGANLVRLPISSVFWRHLGGACPSYRLTVATAIANAQIAGLYVLLALDRDSPGDQRGDSVTGGAPCPLPDAADAAMWLELAASYRQNTGVLFDLFGAPYAVTRQTWLSGGAVNDDCRGAYARPIAYTAVGLESLAARISEIAPATILVVAGRDGGVDLTGVGTVARFPEPNIVFATRYIAGPGALTPQDWARLIAPTAALAPVIVTAVGATNCQTDALTAAFGTIQRLRLAWVATAWTTGDCATSPLISAFDGTPTTPLGSYLRQQLTAQP